MEEGELQEEGEFREEGELQNEQELRKEVYTRDELLALAPLHYETPKELSETLALAFGVDEHVVVHAEMQDDVNENADEGWYAGLEEQVGIERTLCQYSDIDEDEQKIAKRKRKNRWRKVKKAAKKQRQNVIVEEEVYIESEEEDDGPMQRPALYVEGEPNFESGPPEDGWEYVRRVRWEAARCPGTKVAEICPSKLKGEQTPYMPIIPSIPLCDPRLLPSKEWEDEFLISFALLRENLANAEATPELQIDKPLPHIKDEIGWKSFCFGYETKLSPDAADEQQEVQQQQQQEEEGQQQQEEEEEEGQQPQQEEGQQQEQQQQQEGQQQQQEEEGQEQQQLLQEGQSPYVSIVMNLDEVSRAKLLRNQISWLHEVENVSKERAMWLFALAAAIDMPIDADTSCAFRSLLRKCATIRSLQNFHYDNELQMLNIIITVAGKYFGQDG